MNAYPFARLHAGFLVVLALFALRCEHAGPFEPEPLPMDQAPALSDLQVSVFDVTCALSGCHTGANALMGLDLSAGSTYANTVNVPSVQVPDLLLVNPGKPDSSYLVAKLEANSLLRAGTFQMPLGRSPLTDAQIQGVREWIEAGARDD